MRFLVNSALVALAVFVVGISDGYTEDGAMDKPATGVGFGRLHFYRIGHARSDFHPMLRINGEPFARSLPRAYLSIEVPPGRYEIAGARDTGRIATLDIGGNEHVFIKVEAIINPSLQAVYPQVMTPSVAHRDLENLGFDWREIEDRPPQVTAVIGDMDMALQLSKHIAGRGPRVVVGVKGWESYESGLAVHNSAVVKIMSPEEAAAMAEVVLVSVRRGELRQFVTDAGDLSGKVVVDHSFAWQPGDDGYPVLTSSLSGAEQLREWLPESQVVGAVIQPARWNKDESELEGQRGLVYLASDSDMAKSLLSDLYASAGFQIRDMGTLRMSRLLEQLQLVQLMPMLQGRSYGLDVFLSQVGERR